MTGSIKITLYEIYGYLLPGIVFLIGLCLILWSFFLPATPFGLFQVPTQAWVAGLFLAYLLGHLAAAISNLLQRGKALPRAREKVLSGEGSGPLNTQIVMNAKDKAARALGVKVKDIDAKWLYRICDECNMQRDYANEREVYQYRTGFYRGMVVSLSFVCLGLILRIVIPEAAFEFGTGLLIRGPLPLLVLLLFAASGIYFSYCRFVRFEEYQATEAVIAFLLEADKDVSERKAENTK